MSSQIALLNDRRVHDAKPAAIRIFRVTRESKRPLLSRPLVRLLTLQTTLIARDFAVWVTARRSIRDCRKPLSGEVSLPSKLMGNRIAAQSTTSSISSSTTRTSLMRGSPNKATLCRSVRAGDGRIYAARSRRCSAAFANSSNAAHWLRTKPFQCSAGMLLRCFHDLTVWIETFRSAATASTPASLTICACVRITA